MQRDSNNFMFYAFYYKFSLYKYHFIPIVGCTVFFLFIHKNNYFFNRIDVLNLICRTAGRGKYGVK